MAFTAFLGQRARSPGRRMLVLVSVLAHAGLLAVAAGVRPAPAAAPVPEPVLVHLTLPAARPRPSPPPAPAPARTRQARSVPRPRLAQPVPAPAPAPVQPPPAVEEAPVTTDAPEPVAPAEPAGVPGGTAAPDVPLELREVARPPVVLTRATPVYPREARRERVEGTVVVRVIVGRDGLVERERTQVVRSVPGLDAAAIAAVEGWRFSPAVGRSGRLVSVIIEIPFQFYLR